MKSKQPTFFEKYVIYILIGAHIIILSQLAFTAWPEIFSFPYLVDRGFNIYSDFVHPYPPLLTLVLTGLYKLFGYNLIVLRIFTYILIGLTDFFIYKIVIKSSKQVLTAVLAVVFYIVVQSLLEGNMLWFDNALTLPVLLSFYFYQSNNGKKMSLALLVAVLIKQTAVIYIALYALLIVKRKQKKLFLDLVKVLSLGAIFLLTFLLLSNNLNDFLNWTFWYPFKYWSSFPGYVAFNLTKRDIVILILISAPVLISVIKKNYGIALLFVAALIGVYPRFSYFHLQPALAVSAISLGLLTYSKKQFILVTFFIGFVLYYIAKPGVQLWQVRFWGTSEFVLASQINEIVPASSSLFLLGVPSQYYILTNHVPPKPWLDNYGWYYEMPGATGRVFDSFEQNPPDYIIRREPEAGNWYDLGTYEPKSLVSWIKETYDMHTEIRPGLWVWKKKS